MTSTMIDANDHHAKPGYVLYVLYAPGSYAPCPSVFLSDIHRGATPWAAHFTAVYEAVEYVEEMKHRKLIGPDSKLFIRDETDRIVWRNDAMIASNARYLASLYEGDKETSS